MDVEWDERKARTNFQKHAVDFSDAVAAPCALTVPDDSAGEDRFATLVFDGLGRLLVVIYTLRDDRVRLIPVRRATKREQHQYEDGT